MTVSDLQKYLRNLADAVGAAKGVPDGLRAAADGLTPFAQTEVEQFAVFLRDADEYRRTGKVTLPEPKAKGRTAKPKEPAAPKPDASEMLKRVTELHSAAPTDPAITREAVERELAKFESLTATQLQEVYKGCGYHAKAKGNKSDVFKAIVNHVMRPKGSLQRSDA